MSYAQNNKLYKLSFDDARANHETNQWRESRKLSALAKTDIEILTMEVDGTHFDDHLIDTLIETYGLERILYVLYVTVQWGDKNCYTAENLQWLQETADMYSLCWSDVSGPGGSDCQSALALNNNAAYAWNLLLSQIVERQQEEENGKWYVVAHADSDSRSIYVSDPFPNKRLAYRHMKQKYDKFMSDYADEAKGNITENNYSIWIDECNLYGTIRAIAVPAKFK